MLGLKFQEIVFLEVVFLLQLWIIRFGGGMFILGSNIEFFKSKLSEFIGDFSLVINYDS